MWATVPVVSHGTPLEEAFEHHFYPDTLSTDLHRYSVEEPLSVTLPQVMSKMLCLGMSLEDVILKTTAVPAKALGKEHLIGTLLAGVRQTCWYSICRQVASRLHRHASGGAARPRNKLCRSWW